MSAATTDTSGVPRTTLTSWTQSVPVSAVVDSACSTPDLDRTADVLPTSRPILKQATTATQARSLNSMFTHFHLWSELNTA